MATSPYYTDAPFGQVATAAPLATPEQTAMVSQVSTATTVYRFAGAAAAAALAFHGYKRTGSVGWAIAWALGGGLVWPVGLGIAVAQGFGKPKLRSNRRGRR